MVDSVRNSRTVNLNSNAERNELSVKDMLVKHHSGPGSKQIQTEAKSTVQQLNTILNSSALQGQDDLKSTLAKFLQAPSEESSKQLADTAKSAAKAMVESNESNEKKRGFLGFLSVLLGLIEKLAPLIDLWMPGVGTFAATLAGAAKGYVDEELARLPRPQSDVYQREPQDLVVAPEVPNHALRALNPPPTDVG